MRVHGLARCLTSFVRAVQCSAVQCSGSAAHAQKQEHEQVQVQENDQSWPVCIL